MGDESGVLESHLGVERGSDGNALAVDDDDARHTLVGLDSVEGFFDLRHGVFVD